MILGFKCVFTNRLVLLPIVVCTAVFCFSQEVDFRRYYRVDTIKKKNRIKEAIDTNNSFSHLNAIYEYDYLGREILWYYTKGDTKNHTRYVQSKDTLIEIQYVSEGDVIEAPYRVEKYIYNKKGNIILYASCDSSTSCNKVEARLVEFYYGRNEKVESCLHYSSNNYPFKVDEKFPIIKSLFTLWNVEAFYYNQFSQMDLKKQMIGFKESRSIDSFFYDNENRLIQQVTFQKYGYIGERRESDVSFTTSYNYTDSSVIQTEISQYTDYTGKIYRDVDMSYEIVEDKNGLTMRTYFIDDGKKSLSSAYKYTYFK